MGFSRVMAYFILQITGLSDLFTVAIWLSERLWLSQLLVKSSLMRVPLQDRNWLEIKTIDYQSWVLTTCSLNPFFIESFNLKAPNKEFGIFCIRWWSWRSLNQRPLNPDHAVTSLICAAFFFIFWEAKDRYTRSFTPKGALSLSCSLTNFSKWVIPHPLSPIGHKVFMNNSWVTRSHISDIFG